MINIRICLKVCLLNLLYIVYSSIFDYCVKSYTQWTTHSRRLTVHSDFSQSAPTLKSEQTVLSCQEKVTDETLVLMQTLRTVCLSEPLNHMVFLKDRRWQSCDWNNEVVMFTQEHDSGGGCCCCNFYLKTDLSDHIYSCFYTVTVSVDLKKLLNREQHFKVSMNPAAPHWAGLKSHETGGLCSVFVALWYTQFYKSEVHVLLSPVCLWAVTSLFVNRACISPAPLHLTTTVTSHVHSSAHAEQHWVVLRSLQVQLLDLSVSIAVHVLKPGSPAQGAGRERSSHCMSRRFPLRPPCGSSSNGHVQEHKKMMSQSHLRSNTNCQLIHCFPLLSCQIFRQESTK